MINFEYDMVYVKTVKLNLSSKIIIQGTCRNQKNSNSMNLECLICILSTEGEGMVQNISGWQKKYLVVDVTEKNSIQVQF